MREDMHKVIVERPRRAWDPPNRTVRADRRARRDLSPEALDALPQRGPIEPDRGNRKWLNENLAPLRRFLRSCVGRPWDEVYAEIRARLAPSSAVQMHIVQHLFQYVERDVVLVDGRPHARLSRSFLRTGPAPLYDDGRTFYVCPETGLLRRPRVGPPWRGRAARARSAEPSPDRIETPDGGLCLCLDGQWYAIDVAPLPRVVPGSGAAPWDAVLRDVPERIPPDRRRALYGAADRYARGKRQLSNAALRRLGLR
jgi:hypothetical protein